MKLGEAIKERREALDWSQERLADKAGTNQQTIGRIEKGSNSKHLAAVLRVLELDIQGNSIHGSPLAESDNFRPPPPLFEGSIPLHASAEGGRGHVIVSTDEVGRAPRPDVLIGAQHAYAILVTGTSMIDTYEPGDRALVNPHLDPERETDCILYKVEDGEATATIKRLVTFTDRQWTLRQKNPARTFKLDRGVWTIHHRVVGNLKRSFGGRVPFGPR